MQGEGDLSPCNSLTFIEMVVSSEETVEWNASVRGKINYPCSKHFEFDQKGKNLWVTPMKHKVTAIALLASYSILPAAISISVSDMGGSETYPELQPFITDTSGDYVADEYYAQDQIDWGRAFNGVATASFVVPVNYQIATFTASVPNNQSATVPQDGTVSVYDYTDQIIGSELWTTGDTSTVLSSGRYGVKWFVPAKGQGGSSFGFGTASITLNLQPIPEPSACAAIFGLFGLCVAIIRRR